MVSVNTITVDVPYSWYLGLLRLPQSSTEEGLRALAVGFYQIYLPAIDILVTGMSGTTITAEVLYSW